METSATSRELPLACSLNQEEQIERGQLLRSIGTAGLLGVEQRDAELDFRFCAAPGLRGSLEKLIELESECCPFLDFSLLEHDETLVLTVRAPEGSAAILDTIRDMFTLS